MSAKPTAVITDTYYRTYGTLNPYNRSGKILKRKHNRHYNYLDLTT